MNTREQAIEAAAQAICDESIHCEHTDDVDADECRVLAHMALDAALPVLLNDLADRIERCEAVLLSSGGIKATSDRPGDVRAEAARLVRAAAEGWGQ